MILPQVVARARSAWSSSWVSWSRLGTISVMVWAESGALQTRDVHKPLESSLIPFIPYAMPWRGNVFWTFWDPLEFRPGYLEYDITPYCCWQFLAKNWVPLSYSCCDSAKGLGVGHPKMAELVRLANYMQLYPDIICIYLHIYLQVRYISIYRFIVIYIYYHVH